MRASASVLSLACPGERMKRKGLPTASTTVCILVVSPPRHRPIALVVRVN